MRQTAHAIQSRHEVDIDPPSTVAGRLARLTPERLLLLLTPEPSTAALIRRGRRVADYLRADCFAVCVVNSSDLGDLEAEAREHLQRHLDFARGLHIETHVLEGDDVAAAAVDFARRRGVTQIFATRQNQRGWRAWLTGGLVQQIVHLARDMQVTIVADRSTRRVGP